MSESRPLSKQDLNDILNGACILGCGGGGPYSIGTEIVEYLSGLPTPVLLADPDRDVADDQTMAVSAVAGSPDAAGGSAQFPMDIAGFAFEKLNALRSAAGEGNFSFVLPGEVGAGNTFIPMTVAAARGIPVIDAAGARRAIPTLSMCTYASRGVVIAPIVIGSDLNTVWFTAPSSAVAEGPMRSIIGAGGFGEYAGVSFWSMRGAVMKDVAIKGTTSYALGLGSVVREAVSLGHNPVDAVVQYLGGYLLFTGRIVDESEVTAGAFDLGVVVLRADDTGEEVTIFNQNENLIAWNNHSDRPLAIAPDLICYLTIDGEPFSNADLERAQGKQIALIGAPSMPELRAPSIVANFLTLLQSMGYAGSYVPIEELRGQSR